jgi:hypothetical protein
MKRKDSFTIAFLIRSPKRFGSKANISFGIAAFAQEVVGDLTLTLFNRKLTLVGRAKQ